MAPAHVIYADEMRNLKHGYPLWEPECQVSIGDVGYTRDGRFCRLFNASLAPGDPQNEFGVPEGYQPFQLDQRAMVHSTLPPGPMCSGSVTKFGADVGAIGSVAQAGLGFKFACEKDRGAVLIINSEARRKDSEQRGAFEKYMREHYKSWLNFANSPPNSRGIWLSDILFVTGHDHTADWAVAAFSKNTTSNAVQFQASFPNVVGANFSVWGSWSGFTTPHSHCGPRIPHNSIEQAKLSGEVGEVCAADLGNYSQCIFVRGLRMMDRLYFLKILELEGLRGVENGKGSDRLPAVGGMDSAELASEEVENRAPVELLEYMLQQNPEADVAFVHDEDLAAITEGTDSFDIGDMLNKASPSLVVDSKGVGIVSLNSQTSR